LAIIAYLRRVPLVLSVQDVYPESLESQRRTSRRGWFYRLLRRIDLAILHSASQVIVISEPFRQLIAEDRGVDTERVHVIHNWRKEGFIAADSSATLDFRRRLGIPDDAFVAIYAGNVGVASNAEILVDVFALLTNHTQLYLVIAGDGSRLQVCREEITKNQLTRVLIHSPWTTEGTGHVLLQMADVLLLPTKGKQSLYSIPSKLISYLLSGRPVIAAVLPESDTAMTILGTGAGWVVDPESPEMIAQTILAASEHPREKLSQMGAAGREYAQQNFTRDFALPRVIQVILKAAGQQSIEEKSPQSERQCL
jgi:colanic acid biosynthesis glycosyl transferase WcaI